jgi:Holliday junction resolvase
VGLAAGAKGARREREARDLLGVLGFSVIRSAASKTPFDLVAFKATSIWLIQCKSNKWPSRAEVEAMRAFPVPPVARKFVFRFDDRKGLQRREIE